MKRWTIYTLAVALLCGLAIGFTVAVILPPTPVPTYRIVTTNYAGITPPGWVPTNRLEVKGELSIPKHDLDVVLWKTNDDVALRIEHSDSKILWIHSNNVLTIITSNLPPGFRIEYK